MHDLYAQIAMARDAIMAAGGVQPRVALILGSGLGALQRELGQSVVVRYEDITGFPQSTVDGHRRERALGRLEQ